MLSNNVTLLTNYGDPDVQQIHFNRLCLRIERKYGNRRHTKSRR